MTENKQTKLQQLLKSTSDLALTTDIWTDRRQHAFLGVTVHMFDNGKPKSHLLAFKSFQGTHTGQRIAEALESVMTDNQIQSKVRWIVTDNASNMKKAMSVMFDDDLHRLDDSADPSLWEDDDSEDVSSVLSSAKRIPCFAHSLQLVVRDGLSSLTAIRPALAKCSKLANLVHQSAVFRSVFEASLGQGRSIPSTNDTRWNSTFRQLKAIIDLDQAKLNTVLSDANQTCPSLSKKELGQLQELVQILQPFAKATDLTQGDSMVTISCVVPVVLSLARSLRCATEEGSSLTAFVNNLTQGLHDRFCGIFRKLNIALPAGVRTVNTGRDLSFDDDIYLMSSALDPTYAYHWLQDIPSTFEERQATRHHIDGKATSLL